MSEGSGQLHVITHDGVVLVDEGFVCLRPGFEGG